MIKAVFFDVDGTLLSFKTHQVPPSTIEAIQQLQAKGIKTILSTGRSINSLDHVSFLNFDGFITFNGGYCVTQEQKILLKKTLNPQDVQNLINSGKENPPVSFSLMSESEISICNISKKVSAMYEELNLPLPVQRSYDNFDVNSVLQANIFMGPEEEKTFMPKYMPNSLSSRWTPLFADVNPHGQSKQVGLDIFIQHFDLNLSETMAFGDGGNDITMLKHAGTGVAMGNANPEVKQIANYITSDVDDDGIWNALKHFGVL